MKQGERERFVRDPVPVRLGNLASSLARTATYAGKRDRIETVDRLLGECTRFTEWAGIDMEPERQPAMVDLQLELARWRLRWPRLQADADARAELADALRERSEQVLQWSGLLDG